MIRFQLLGPVDLLREDGARLDSILTQPKRLALLAYLAVARPRGLHRRDALLALFWPDLGESQGRAALRQALFFLRRSAGPDVLPGRGADEVGVDRNLIRTDVEAVEAALELADADATERSAHAQSGERALETLVERPLMDAFHVSGVPGFERWLEGERRRLFNLGRDTAARMASRAEAAGDVVTAVRTATLRLRLDPLDERAARHLVELKLRAGDRTGAVQVWQELEALWRSELGVSPTLDGASLIDVANEVAQSPPPDSADGEAATPPAIEPRPPDGPATREQASTGGSSGTGGRSPGRRRSTILLSGVFLLAVVVSLSAAGSALVGRGSEAEAIPEGRVRANHGASTWSGATGRKGILWVDDNPELNTAERARLHERGAEVTVALGTAEALELFDPTVFQLVISDIGRYRDGVYQPGAGLDLLSRLREQGDSVRVIFYTSARAARALEDEVEARGGDGITDSMEELFRLVDGDSPPPG